MIKGIPVKLFTGDKHHEIRSGHYDIIGCFRIFNYGTGTGMEALDIRNL